MIAIAYACSVGGIATLVGTRPNLSFSRIFAVTFPDAPPIAFGQWLLLGIPITLVMLLISWLGAYALLDGTAREGHADHLKELEDEFWELLTSGVREEVATDSSLSVR